MPSTEHQRSEPLVQRSDISPEIDQVDKHAWHQIIQRFDDAHLCQMWSYGATRWGEDKLSHLVLKTNREIVAAAQVAIIKIPVVAAGVAYVKWGPMWRLRGTRRDLEICRHTMIALREHYAARRKLLLRIMPTEVDDDNGAMRSILESEGLKRRYGLPEARHWRIDLSRSAEELHKNLKRNWRYCLTRAEKFNLEITESTGTDALDTFFQLYDEMQCRKSFVDFSDINYFRKFQTDLPEPLKVRVLVCWYHGEALAALAVSLLGDTGLALYGATGNRGRQMGASYFLDWWTTNWLRDQGYRWYDLGGSGTPGVSFYKAGLAGKDGKITEFVGKFDSPGSLRSRIVVELGESLRSAYRSALKVRFND